MQAHLYRTIAPTLYKNWNNFMIEYFLLILFFNPALIMRSRRWPNSM